MIKARLWIFTPPSGFISYYINFSIFYLSKESSLGQVGVTTTAKQTKETNSQTKN